MSLHGISSLTLAFADSGFHYEAFHLVMSMEFSDAEIINWNATTFFFPLFFQIKGWEGVEVPKGVNLEDYLPQYAEIKVYVRGKDENDTLIVEIPDMEEDLNKLREKCKT